MTSTDHIGQTTTALRELDAGFSGVLAVAARAEDTGEVVTHDADRVLPTASVIKLAVLAEVFRQDATGPLSLREKIALDEGNRVGGSGVLKDLSPGVVLPVLDYATLMIVVSDNSATNTLIDLVGGVGPVNGFMRELGLDTITLHRKVVFGAPGGPAPLLGEASPRHLMELMGLLWRRELVSAAASERMLAILGRQHYLDQAPRLLRHDPLATELGAEPEVGIACKTGMIGGIRADAGLLRLRGRPVSYAIMTDGSADTALYVDQEGMRTVAAAGAALAECFWPGPGPAPVRAGSGPGQPSRSPSVRR
ncbi:MAG TPA: serine hydrolase [Amycolatopsis sp.]|nr:serine hydrolase [Amycolatopsis sp.]